MGFGGRGWRLTYSPSHPPGPRTGACGRAGRSASLRVGHCWRNWRCAWCSADAELLPQFSCVCSFVFLTRYSPYWLNHGWTESACHRGWFFYPPPWSHVSRSNDARFCLFKSAFVSIKYNAETLARLRERNWTGFGRPGLGVKMVIQLKVRMPHGNEIRLVNLCDNEKQIKRMTVSEMKTKIAEQLQISTFNVFFFI